MGVFIHYAFHAECPEEELLARLRRLRREVSRLPLRRVGRIVRLDPAYESMPLDLLRQHGYRLPAAVRARLKGKTSLEYRMKCGVAAPVVMMLVPEEMERRSLQPAEEFLKTTDLWNDADLPEKIECGSMTWYRSGFAYAMAEVMLRHGYLLILDPGEGSETVHIGLTTWRRPGTPYWLGSGFTKTQYAVHFTTAHENVCRILDAAKEVGLLYRAQDTCGFYEHRSWKQAAPIVNQETTFAHVMGGVLSAGVAAAQAAGVPIQDLSNPATKNYNLVHVDDDAAPPPATQPHQENSPPP